MTIHLWIMYLSIVLAATATPGPAVLFIITNSGKYGWKKATFAALGNIAGLFTLGLIAVTGLGALLKTSVVIFNLIKYAGAAYLIYLGLKLILQKGTDLAPIADSTPTRGISSGKIFLQALAVALSNPKAIVFLTALFPQFIHTGEPVLPQFTVLIATLMLFSFLFLMAYSLMAHKAKTWLARPGRLKTFNRTSGSVFIGFGLLLAASSNR